MKKIVIICLSFSIQGFSQNLVPNHSFEDFYNIDLFCSYNKTEYHEKSLLEHNPNWFRTCLSADIYDIKNHFNMPCNSLNQFVNSVFGRLRGQTADGDFAAGIGAGTIGRPESNNKVVIDYYERLASKLTSKLKKGAVYHYEFYYTYSWPSFMINSYYILSGFGIGFFKNKPNCLPSGSMVGQALVIKDLPSDTIQIWHKETGCFVAQDEFEYIEIGHYLPDNLIKFMKVEDGQAASSSYFIIDNIKIFPIEDVLVPSLGEDRVSCDGSPVVLDVGFDSGEWVWQDGSRGRYHLAEKSGVYWVESLSGECRLRDSIRVSIEVMPNLSDTFFCEGQQLRLDAGSASVVWDNSKKRYRDIRKPGVYFYQIPGCGTDSVLVSIQDCGLLIPNLFTPNGDGVNDTWMIDGLERARWRVSIFNRYGQEVYHSQAYQGLWGRRRPARSGLLLPPAKRASRLGVPWLGDAGKVAASNPFWVVYSTTARV